jgi:glycosyltransferase involved in cell wall biosynthesis
LTDSSPLVSIGIPTFNRPEGLRETLKRITAQTYENLEILVSDNHSEDEGAARRIVEEQGKGRSIRFFRQPENIGAIRNLKFLLNQARGDYFAWAADDDLLDPPYVEKCVDAIRRRPGAVVGITGFDVEDRMGTPVIKKEYTRYLAEISASGAFERMRNYVLQPEYYGKYRILWGVIDRKVLQESFEQVLQFLAPGERPLWSYMPIDFAVLSRGDLAVHPECLFHVTLLPTSDGMKESHLIDASQLKLNRKGFRAFNRVVTEADALTAVEKLKLKACLLWEEAFSLARILPFQIIRSVSPGAARAIKKIWFDTLVTK